jgi:predicted unusual protein kinase regulating ubiquinone biosynthesis (AarF/ABC1/UbiB family)
MSVFRKLPEGRATRLAKLAALGVRTGASLLIDRDGTSAAERAAEVLGTMRGLAAKIGQMASYVDGMVPDGQRESFEKALRTLRAAAPTSSPTSIRRAIEAELGAPLSELFAHFDDAPIASASIGQVHAARLHDGRNVAVKVQHPGIRKAVSSDLDNAGLLESLVGHLGVRKLGSSEAIAELRERFLEELDYRLEAASQTRFSAIHAGDPTIRIPAVIADRSAEGVLTTELVQGVGLDEAASGSEAERRAYAETLWRFVFKGNLIGGCFNADPHPGNFIFQGDGQIAFLDFGCVQPILGERLEHARELHAAALRRDEAAFRRFAAMILKTRGGRYEELATAYSRRCFEPVFASPFRIDRAYTKSLVDALRAMTTDVLTGKSELVPLPPGMLFMNRLQFGFYSVLASLDVEVDYARVERAFLEASLEGYAWGEPVTTANVSD